MMKKIVTSLTVIVFSLFLVACQPEKEVSTAWLEGEWHSTEWDLTYEIEEDDGKWSIKSAEEVVTENAELAIDGKTFTLSDKEGVEYFIKKKSDTEMRYQQAETGGATRITTEVTFEKVGD